MPSPMIPDPTPSGGVGRHSAPADRPHGRGPARIVPSPADPIPAQYVPLREAPAHPGPGATRRRGEFAVELPAWDLLPPVEFVRRHRGGT